MAPDNTVKVIGRVEPVALPEITERETFARIDTGAQTSAVWVSCVKLEDNRLAVKFFGPGHRAYTGTTHYFDEYSSTVVASSNGQTELRYKVKLLVGIGGKKIRARFTLANRSTQVYPILIGRNVLRGKFIVDVTRGTPLVEEEMKHSKNLQARFNQGKQS